MVGYSAYPSWDAGMLFAVLMVCDGIGWLVDCEELFFEALVMCVRVWESSAEAASHWPSPTPFDIRRAFLRLHILSSMNTLRRPISLIFKSPQFFTRMASTRSAAIIKSLDHLVLTVQSIPASTKWYTQNLGMRSESFISAASPDITRYSLIFGSQKINLHQLGNVGLCSFLILHYLAIFD